jgi:hypothetical protein
MHWWLFRWIGRRTCEFESRRRINGVLPDGQTDNGALYPEKFTQVFRTKNDRMGRS